MKPRRLPASFGSKRLHLHLIGARDARAWHDLLNRNAKEFGAFSDAEGNVARPTLPQTKETIAFLVQSARAKTFFQYAIFQGKALIGTINAKNFRWGADACEIGYTLDKAHWGHGFISEALVAFEKLLAKEGFNRIDLRINTRNKRSLRLARRNGYKREGTLHAISRHLFDVEHGRNYSDSAVYAKFLKGSAPAQT